MNDREAFEKLWEDRNIGHLPNAKAVADWAWQAACQHKDEQFEAERNSMVSRFVNLEVAESTLRDENERLDALAKRQREVEAKLQGEINRMEATIAELEAQRVPEGYEEMLASLPQTADGAPILPGMTVYCAVGQHVDERKVLGPIGKAALYTFEPARHGAGPGRCHRLANTVYAVRENAISAAPPAPTGDE